MWVFELQESSSIGNSGMESLVNSLLLLAHYIIIHGNKHSNKPCKLHRINLETFMSVLRCTCDTGPIMMVAPCKCKIPS